jgi:uncharacterized protein (DUF4415 family)
MEERKRTAAQERRHTEMMIELERQEAGWRDLKLRMSLIPNDWHRMDALAPVRPRRKKVTIALDEDVARWFAGLGEGYHRRMNSVLRTYMLALISKEVLSLGDVTREGDEIWGRKARKGEE